MIVDDIGLPTSFHFFGLLWTADESLWFRQSGTQLLWAKMRGIFDGSFDDELVIQTFDGLGAMAEVSFTVNVIGLFVWSEWVYDADLARRFLIASDELDSFYDELPYNSMNSGGLDECFTFNFEDVCTGVDFLDDDAPFYS